MGGSDIPTISTQLSPRIDDENSFLGLVDFCKTNGKGPAPFGNQKFADMCGMCMSSGKLITGETFNTPTGVVVYPDDKEKAQAEQVTNSLPFPRIVPSLNAATCVGASKSLTSKPVLAITQEEFDAITKRLNCQESQEFDGKGCGKCLTDQEWSWVDLTKNATTHLYLWGYGKATIFINGSQKDGIYTLELSKPTMIDLGVLLEGDGIEVHVSGTGELINPSGGPSDFVPPYFYGMIQSILPNKTKYQLPINKFLVNDTASGQPIKKGISKQFTESSASLQKFVMGTAKGLTSIKAVGHMPLTFITPEELSAYDCPSAPYITKQESWKLVGPNDPCADGSPGSYNDACLRNSVIAAECSTNGNWWRNPGEYAGNMSIRQFKVWLSSQTDKVLTDTTASYGCYGKDIPTPCDTFMGNSSLIPDAACLSYLYSGESIAAPSLGTGYPSCTPSSSDSQYQFCSEKGAINPQNDASVLTAVAKGYNGLTGIQAVKAYLTETYLWAVKTGIDSSLSDASGGNNTSQHNCFGIPLNTDPIPLKPTGVVLQKSTDIYGNIKAKVSYTPTDTGAVKYLVNIYKNNDVLVSSSQNRIGKANTLYTFDTLMPGSGLYYATVTATNTAGESIVRSNNLQM